MNRAFHNVWVDENNGKMVVRMCNDDDSWYLEEFETREAVDAFIEKLSMAADAAFGTIKESK